MNKSSASEPCDIQDSPPFGFILHHANRLFTRVLDSELRHLGVTAAQLGPLIVMEQSGEPVLQRDLLKRSAIAQPAMVAAVKLLTRNGLIVQQPCEQDGRATVLELTQHGREVVERARPILNRCNSLALSGFSDERATELIRLISAVISNIQHSPTDP